MAMYMGHFTWPSQDIPTNFTAFALPQYKADALDVVGMVVKATDGKDLDVSDMKSLTKLHLKVLSLLNETCHMFNNMAVLCTKITGNYSFRIQRIYSWVTFFNINEEWLTHMGSKDHIFLKVLYSVDTAKEAYL
eukprot:10150614-Ditylum_brightwellii.AAC.1